MGVVFVSKSGGGKGISDKVGRLAWPAEIIERPIGSGEGIAAMFVPPKKEGIEPVTRAILSVPEIDTLAGVAARQGSILLAQLKSALMGELLGQSNASEATTRIVQAHSYRCCLSIGAQPGHADVIFNDSSGGTPQRMLWLPTTDPAMPADQMPDPEPLDVNLPGWARSGGMIAYGPDEIRETIVEAHLARQRGEGDALDGHSLLTRCKVAACLAVMHHRSVVSDRDWQLSGTVMEWSNSTRDWMIDQARQASRAKVHDRAVARAIGDAIYDDRMLEGVKRSIVRMLERDGEQPGNILRSRLGKREKRDLFDQAIGLLEADGLVCERVDEYKGARRVRYQIGSGLTNEVRSHNPSSEGATQLVRPDQLDNITDIDTRRSADNPPRKLTAREWFANYISELQTAGHTTAKSVAALEAGVAAGFTKGNLRMAFSAHPDVRTISRKGGTATWSIEPGKKVAEYQGAPQWLDEYLDQQTDTTLDPDDVRIAGENAGHPWHSVRRAAGMSPRIESIPANGNARNDRVWLITPTAEEEAGA